MKRDKPFPTEADLCARFIAALPEGWTAYAETCGWDILLVRKADGFQIGVEAKLKFNAHVICQALEEHGDITVCHPGPDCRAVLVPEGEGGLGAIAAYIGVTVISVRPDRRGYLPVFSPDLPKIGCSWSSRDWHEWGPAQRHQLPDYVPDVAAGAPAPVQLTTWKIAALKIEATIELRGFVTRADFKHIGIDHRRWFAAEVRWLASTERGYVAGDRFPNFKSQHPTVYAQIIADAGKWMRAESRPELFGASGE